jgi:hypothetical protein
MADETPARAPLPPDSLECRQKAAALLTADIASPAEATAWVLLAIAGDLAAIRRDLGKRR